MVGRVEWLVLGDVFSVGCCLWAPPHPRFKPGAGSSPLPREVEGKSFGCRSIAASLYWVRAGETGYSFLIQNTASPMSPDHRSSGRLLVGEPFGVSQFLSVVVL